MSPKQKLLEEVAYWEARLREAKESLQYAETVLPKLRASMDELGLEWEGGGGETETKLAPPSEALTPPIVEALQPAAVAIPPLRGKCEDQVEGALGYKSPQSSLDLVEFLEEHGDAFSRGAIDYALRSLAKQSKIRETRKVGNLRYWELAPEEDEAASN